MKNEYNEYNQFYVQNAVSVGSHNDVHDNAFQQFVNTTDQDQLNRLAEQLNRLRTELAVREEATSAEGQIAIGQVAEAELAARRGDRQSVWQHLARIGRWALDVANQIGIQIAVEAINEVFKYYNIPIS